MTTEFSFLIERNDSLTIAPPFRFVILCWTWLWELWEQLHGACWCPKSILFRQLSLCSEHTETDAGEGDWTQCLPLGHVQKKVWILWFYIIFTLVIHSLVVIILTLIHIASEMYTTMPRQTLCSKLQPILCLDMPRELLSVFLFHPEITCWSTFCSLSDMLCWDILCLWSCQDAEAFELSSSGFTNGVFIKFLKERLLEDEKITVLLDRVAEGEGTLSMLKLNGAWQLLLVKCRPIKLKQMINWFEMCATTFCTYLFCTLITTSKINLEY